MNKAQADKALHRLKEQLTKRFGPTALLYLFGSVARGEFEPLSDIDVMVLLDGPVAPGVEEEIFDMAYAIELDYNVVFGIVVFSRNFWESPQGRELPLRKSIDREGVLI